jgi:hypothetical protein
MTSLTGAVKEHTNIRLRSTGFLEHLMPVFLGPILGALEEVAAVTTTKVAQLMCRRVTREQHHFLVEMSETTDVEAAMV